MSLAEDITALIARAAGVEPDQLQPQTRLDDLGLDSVAVVELIFALEEWFDISIPFNPAGASPDEAGFDPTSLGSVIASINALIARERCG